MIRNNLGEGLALRRNNLYDQMHLFDNMSDSNVESDAMSGDDESVASDSDLESGLLTRHDPSTWTVSPGWSYNDGRYIISRSRPLIEDRTPRESRSDEVSGHDDLQFRINC
jgi:hypothetical protein